MQKIIPPVLLIIAIIVMILLHFFTPSGIIFFYPVKYLGVLLIIIGLMMAKQVSVTFSKVETEIHTFKKPKRLVTNGLFQYSRNPIYVGFLILLMGVNILLGSVTPFICVLLFFLITDNWYIPFEEKIMLEQFGKAYEAYKKKVRRWL